ncbi:MAG: [FeFe] hydrogenase H-cluster maturation GTPase HydF [Bacteroidetes bacterium]|nr:MAG: [FeFe] hydrogenase H-cluster maturation GTPase HydF [Bacteroidota bacterium]
MLGTPKSLRLQIALFGRTNTGKSSFLNMIANQDVALTSPVPGTTTDVVEKSMELLPIGPVTFLDTAGIDDKSILSNIRIEKTMKIVDRAEIIVLICEPNIWTDYEENISDIANRLEIPIIIAINKIDIEKPTEEFRTKLKSKTGHILYCSCIDKPNSNKYVNEFKKYLPEILPTEYTNPLPLIGDLVPQGSVSILIVPIDREAPKGRIILPQVQAIRDLLDSNSMSLVVKDTEYSLALKSLVQKPALVVCDSQVVNEMVAETPADVKCTTFSILFSRFKGDLLEEVRGAAEIKKLKAGDKILIAEACSHHPNEDDIGRVKIPRWLRQYIGYNIHIDYSAGRDYPANLNDYKLIIHCGGCMLTRNEKLVRIHKAKEAGVPITNYGITISVTQGVLERVLSPFPEALVVYKKEINN